MAEEHDDGRDEADHEAGDGGVKRGDCGYETSCDGAEALYGVETVGLAVLHVVEEVERRRDEAEAGEHTAHEDGRTPSACHRALAWIAHGEEPGRGDEEVLGPLMDAHGARPVLYGLDHLLQVLHRMMPQRSEWSV